MMKKPIQMSLFAPKRPEPKKPITFASLSVHAKINYKANECGFGGIVYRSKYNYFESPLFQPKTDELSNKYWWHHRKNAGGENRIKRWRKSKDVQRMLSFM